MTDETELNESQINMLLLQSLDPRAYIGFSEFTQQFYVCSHVIDEYRDGVCTGAAEHRDKADWALSSYVARLKIVGQKGFKDQEGKFIGVNVGRADPRFYRWNGVVFAEQSIDYVRAWAKTGA